MLEIRIEVEWLTKVVPGLLCPKEDSVVNRAQGFEEFFNIGCSPMLPFEERIIEGRWELQRILQTLPAIVLDIKKSKAWHHDPGSTAL